MHSVYMNQPAPGSTGPYAPMPVAGAGESLGQAEVGRVGMQHQSPHCALSAPDPNMVNAYVYQAGAGSGQAAPQGQVVPTTNPAYSSYQPTPTQGYQASEQSTGSPLPVVCQTHGKSGTRDSAVRGTGCPLPGSWDPLLHSGDGDQSQIAWVAPGVPCGMGGASCSLDPEGVGRELWGCPTLTLCSSP